MSSTNHATRIEKLQLLLSCMDFTSLDPEKHQNHLRPFISVANKDYASRHVAAVCIFPEYAGFVKPILDEKIKLAVVGGDFPTGLAPLSAKLEELKIIDASPCDEVDVVINRNEFLAGNYDFVKEELKAMRAAVPTKMLKIILETGELKTAGNITRASEIAIDAGADFIKTSTGKITVGATPAAVRVMCEVILGHAKKTGKKIGIKPSGGIREISDALTYLDIVENTLGAGWLQPSLFRIGASTLLGNLISELEPAHE